VPYLRCTDPDECGWEGFERSQLAVGSPCPRCEGDTEVVTDYDEPASASASVTIPPSRPGLAFPRERARQVLKTYNLGNPPIPVHAIARHEGFGVCDSSSLGALRGRLIDERIEVAAGDSWAVKRFTVAHELGHHFLGSTHESAPHVESEANAFAGELLVPGHLLHAALTRTNSQRELAEIFAVSQSVLRIAAETHRELKRLTR